MKISRTASSFAALGLVGTLAIASPASAADIEIGNWTACSQGSAIRIAATSGSGQISATVTVNGSAAGQTWGVSLSDNWTYVYGGLKRADAAGDVAVTRSTADQSGTDNLIASAVNFRTGEVCAATLSV